MGNDLFDNFWPLPQRQETNSLSSVKPLNVFSGLYQSIDKTTNFACEEAFLERRRGTPTKRPKLLGREKQTAKTGAHGRRKETGKRKIYVHMVLAYSPAESKSERQGPERSSEAQQSEAVAHFFYIFLTFF